MKKILLIVLPLIIIIGGLLGGGYYLYENTINTNAIYKGVTIENYDVGGMTKEKAIEFLRQQKEIDDANKSINLSYEDKSYDISLDDMGYTYNFEDTAEAAYNIGRDGNLIERYKNIKEIEKSGKQIFMEPDYDRDKILKIVEDIEKYINQESVDAIFNFNNGNFKVSEDRIGITVKTSELINLLVDNMYELEDIEIPVDITEPKVTKKLLSRINGVIGEFSTSFKGSANGRIQNIKLSSQAMGNLLILPGQEISYNNTLGPVQAKYGYMEAPVILNGELTPGMGGGVCQSSTTLYNALLLADVTIVERHPHSIAAAYVPRGTDGAVASGYLDLKFRNDYDFPIYTYSKIVGDKVYFYVYGDTTAKDYTVKIEPELIETIPHKVNEVLDSTLEPGARQLVQEGRNGYKVRTYKSIIKNGQVIERKQITYDYYREKDFIYKVGPALSQNSKPADTSGKNNNNNNNQSVESLDPIEDDIEVIDLILP
jgi:vancomycin resistance protein YoaR